MLNIKLVNNNRLIIDTKSFETSKLTDLAASSVTVEEFRGVLNKL